MLRRFDEIPLIPRHERKFILVCYGPSLLDNLTTLKDLEGDVYSVSGAHDVLIANGIVPRGHVECDPRPHKAKFLKSPHPETTYFLASCCHKDTLDAIPHDQVVLWHSAQSKEEDRYIESVSPGAFTVLGGTTVGTRALSVGTVLGYRDFEIFGMDCSFEQIQHAGEHSNDAKESEFLEVQVNSRGPKWRTTTLLAAQVQDFLRHISETPDCQYKLHGKGMLQHMFQNEVHHSRCQTAVPLTWNSEFKYIPFPRAA
jgi:hypothetical protein